MAQDTYIKSPNYVHPEKPGAVGSRNSLNRGERDEYQEAKMIIDEEVDKVLNHIHAKLPPEVLEKLDIMGSIKSKLHNYFNQDFQNMSNRYIVTMEDEMNKKFRDLIDKEEKRVINQYNPRDITDLLSRLGSDGTFNTQGFETSVVDMYGHLQEHIQRGMSKIETNATRLLDEKSDVGAIVGNNAYSIVKCSFRDNKRRPKTVMDLKLSISILDSELVNKIYHYQVPVSYIIKDIIAKKVHELIDREIEESTHSVIESGEETASPSERLFERFRIMDKYISNDDSEDSKRYQFIAKKFLDAIEGIKAEIEPDEYDALNIRENIKKIVDNENLRNKGFNKAVNTITNILDSNNMGYQYIENYKNARECIIKEYEEDNPLRLPDERYGIKMVYYDDKQLEKLRKSYSIQLKELNREVMHLWDVCEGIYQSDRNNRGYDDWATLSNKMLNEEGGKKRSLFGGKKESVVESNEKAWNEIAFIAPKETEVEKSNPTGELKIEEIANRFQLMLDKLEKVYGEQNDETRMVVEARLKFLKQQFEEFSSQINPFHVQPGLLLDIDITSIKKKKSTINNMANVINSFIGYIAKSKDKVNVQSQLAGQLGEAI